VLPHRGLDNQRFENWGRSYDHDFSSVWSRLDVRRFEAGDELVQALGYGKSSGGVVGGNVVRISLRKVSKEQYMGTLRSRRQTEPAKGDAQVGVLQRAGPQGTRLDENEKPQSLPGAVTGNTSAF
jgi:hypothetical protein